MRVDTVVSFLVPFDLNIFTATSTFVAFHSLKDNLVACTPALLATAAFLCGTFGILYCETLEFPQEDGDATLFVGAWSYRTRNYVQAGDEIWVFQTCRGYDYLDKELGFAFEMDSKAKTVQAFSIIAAIFGGLVTVASFMAPCSGALSESRWKMMGKIFLLVGIFQGLTLLIQSSSICLNNPVLQYLESQSLPLRDTLPDECQWGPGHKMNISAVVMWFAAGLATQILKCPEIDTHEPPQTQTVTYQRNPDGTVQETSVEVVKGVAVEELDEQYKE